MHTTTIAHFVGIDVSKASLDLYIRPSGEGFTQPNTADGIRAICARLTQLAPELIVVEATGGLERPLALALGQHALPVAVVNARRTRNFAKALDQLAKTDQIDRAVIAHFAEAVRPTARPLPDAAALERDALQTRRRQLVRMLSAERNHLASAPASVRSLIAPQIEHLARLVDQIDAALRAAVRADERLKARQTVLTSVTGIGEVTSTMLIALLPELGQLTHKQLGRLVGVAPLNDDSGTRDGKRHCWGGRADVRAALYLPTLTATRYNPVIKAFFQRLIGKGKPFKVAMIACMRKLLTILNAMARDNTRWADRLARSS
jgi:transposase